MAGERTISIKFDGSAAGFARAAKKAERALSDWERQTGKVKETVSKVGAAAGQTFFQQLSSSLSQVGSRAFGLGGPLAVVAIPAAAVVGTAAAAALSGALTAGISAGVIAGGIALAARHPKVQSAFGDLGDEILEELTVAASVFVDPVVRAAGRIRATFHNLDLRTPFASAARYVDPLVGGLLGLAHNVLPGVTRAIDRAAPIIDVISRNLPRLGTAISDAFDKISGNSQQAAGGLEWVFLVIEKIIGGGASFIAFLTQAFGWIVNVGDAAGATADVLLGWVPILGDQVDKGRASIDRIKKSMEGAKNAGDDWRSGTVQLTASGKLASAAQEQMWQRTKILTGSMEDAINAAGGLSQAFKLLNGAALTAREAEAGYQAAIDEVTASIKENGKTLDLHTAKGRANDQAIRNLIASIDRKAQATYDDVAATKGSQAAQVAATQVYEQGRAQLVKNLTQILGNAGAAEKLADEIMQIPKSWSTTVKANTSSATAAIKSFQKKINTLDGRTITVTAKFTPQGNLYIPGQGTLTKRWGGIDYAMASGGFPPAHITRTPTVLYGERETGGEAYIPRRGDLSRNRRIAETVVRRWLGGDVAWGRPAARGGRSAPAVAGGGGITVERLEVKAYSDRFRLSQVMQDLAMLGVH